MAAGLLSVAALATGVFASLVVRVRAQAQERGESYFYHHVRRTPPSLESVFSEVAPGYDAFPEERDAEELAVPLEQLSAALRASTGRAAAAIDGLLADGFKGGRLAPLEETQTGPGGALEIFRATPSASAAAGGITAATATAPANTATATITRLNLDRGAFRTEWAKWLADFSNIDVAEFLIVGIAFVEPSGPANPPHRVRTLVRYDITGSGSHAFRAEQLGLWQMTWQRTDRPGGPGSTGGTGGTWRVTEWSASEQLRSGAAAPVFTEVTARAFGANASFQRQLRYGSDAWLASLDSALMLDTNAHHGVAVGDVDGDGLDDLYICQPSGLPGLLYRNRGDGTFEDITERAGLGVLDSTSQALFLDIDNDGDQDLVLVTRTGLMLFVNDGKGHFTYAPDAFHLKNPLRGSPISIAAADFDRDGFVDIYLCTYSYFIGSSEDKGGPATPYHDAKNGPPNILFRNDGTGHFVDVTDEVGLNENNDRFSLAAAWADYDGDGWPDLLVANDFGRKNLYHNEGLQNGRVRFKDVAPKAGVEDYGAGMSATWFDFDNDGRLDAYVANMWTAAGLRVTGEPGFMPGAPADIRAHYRHHASGNSLFHNRGDGTFDDVTLASHAEMGRWAWCSDAVDFDLDGWDDLYIVNGMFTRQGRDRAVAGHDAPAVAHDLDSFFWRQAVAKSPLTRQTGTPYEDGWRAINRLLVADGSQAPHERNVFLRNNGHGGFDEISGTVGLDLDQDGRTFAAIDYDGDGAPDIVVVAARASPQLRLFHNDFKSGNAALAVRLAGTRSNRDAIGAIVTVEGGGQRRTKAVLAGSGFLSERPRELIFGLGKNRAPVRVSIRWPSGETEAISDVPADRRVWVQEGKGAVRTEPLPRGTSPGGDLSVRASARASDQNAPKQDAPTLVVPAMLAGQLALDSAWLFEPFPLPDVMVRDLDGQEHSLTAARGGPTAMLFWSPDAPASIDALRALAQARGAITSAQVSILPIAIPPAGADSAKAESAVRAVSQGTGFTAMLAPEAAAGSLSILHRYMFARREDLRLPTLLLVSKSGDVMKVYRDRIDARQVGADVAQLEASPAERLRRAVPFPGTFYAPPEGRDYFQYALELGEQGFERQAIPAFERVVSSQPSAIAFQNLGTLQMKAGRPADATAAFRRALELKPDYAEANNSLGAMLAQSGDVAGAVARFRAAIAASPENADALNNLGFALFQSGETGEAFDLFQRALKARPDFPEALNNLGIFYGRQGQLDRAEPFFREAVEKRPDYGEAANNLALVLARRGDPAGAVAVLEGLLAKNPAFETGYLTLCRLYLTMNRLDQAQRTLQNLLQRNPRNPAALELLEEIKRRNKSLRPGSLEPPAKSPRP